MRLIHKKRNEVLGELYCSFLIIYLSLIFYVYRLAMFISLCVFFVIIVSKSISLFSLSFEKSGILWKKKNRRKCWVNEVKVIVLNVGLLSTQCSLKKKNTFFRKKIGG